TGDLRHFIAQPRGHAVAQRAERSGKAHGFAERERLARVELEQIAHSKRKLAAIEHRPGLLSLAPSLQHAVGEVQPELGAPLPQRLKPLVWNVDSYRKAAHAREKFPVDLARRDEQLP